MDLMLRRRGMMKAKSKTYVSIYSSMFPANGAVSGRNNLFIYLTEAIAVGTRVHLKLDFTTIDSAASVLGVRDTAASIASVVIPMPTTSVDIEYTTRERATSILWCYFDVSVTGVQRDKTTIKVEKII